MTTKRRLTKGLLPVLLLSAALSVPATSVAAPSPDGKAYGVEKAQNNGRRAWRGWNNNKRYSRYGSGMFQLEGTFIGQQNGCALVQDRRGQVIPLLGNPGDLRKGDYLVMSGRIQNSSVCGTAFRVFSMDSINDRDYDRYNDRSRRDPNYDDRRYNSDNRNLVSITGRLDDSGRCPVVRGDHGEYYDLVGDLRDFRAGDHARVVGFLGVRSRCGGQAIDVKEIN